MPLSVLPLILFPNTELTLVLFNSLPLSVLTPEGWPKTKPPLVVGFCPDPEIVLLCPNVNPSVVFETVVFVSVSDLEVNEIPVVAIVDVVTDNLVLSNITVLSELSLVTLSVEVCESDEDFPKTNPPTGLFSLPDNESDLLLHAAPGDLLAPNVKPDPDCSEFPVDKIFVLGSSFKSCFTGDLVLLVKPTELSPNLNPPPAEVELESPLNWNPLPVDELPPNVKPLLGVLESELVVVGRVKPDFPPKAPAEILNPPANGKVK